MVKYEFNKGFLLFYVIKMWTLFNKEYSKNDHRKSFLTTVSLLSLIFPKYFVIIFTTLQHKSTKLFATHLTTSFTSFLIKKKLKISGNFSSNF